MLSRFLVPAGEQRFAVADVPRLPQTGLRGAAIIASAVLAIVTDQTSSAIASAGLPYLSGIVGATPDESSWILTAFNAAYYAMILLSPWMMARVGRKRLMLVALLGFALISAMLALVTDYHLFVALRSCKARFSDASTCRRRCCFSRRCPPPCCVTRRRSSCSSH